MNLVPEQRLWLAVLNRALLDLKNFQECGNVSLERKQVLREYAQSAKAFFYTEGFESICEVLNYRPEFIRRKVNKLFRRIVC